MAGRARDAGVSWSIVDQELARVDADFKNPKFYALKHVVEILSANDPQGLVTQVSRETTLTCFVQGAVLNHWL